jgi:hypothetical protein
VSGQLGSAGLGYVDGWWSAGRREGSFSPSTSLPLRCFVFWGLILAAGDRYYDQRSVPGPQRASESTQLEGVAQAVLVHVLVFGNTTLPSLPACVRPFKFKLNFRHMRAILNLTCTNLFMDPCLISIVHLDCIGLTERAGIHG